MMFLGRTLHEKKIPSQFVPPFSSVLGSPDQKGEGYRSCSVVTSLNFKMHFFWPGYYSYCMYLSNQVCSCMSRNHISKFLGKVFFCSKCITKQKLGVALADTVHTPLWVAWQELYIHQIPVPLSCLLGKLFGNVDLQVIYVRILILLQRWDAVVSKVYSSCGFVDTGLWPGK